MILLCTPFNVFDNVRYVFICFKHLEHQKTKCILGFGYNSQRMILFFSLTLALHNELVFRVPIFNKNMIIGTIRLRCVMALCCRLNRLALSHIYVGHKNCHVL